MSDIVKSFLKKDKTVFLGYFVLLLILFYHAALYATHQIPMTTLSDDRLLDTLFNADALYLPALYKDIVVDGGSFSQWYLPPAPYFFPDIFLYFIVNAISGNYYYAIALFFLVEWLILTWILYRIYRLFFSPDVVLIWLPLILFLLIYFPSPVSYLIYISDFHYAGFIIGLIILYLVIIFLFSEYFSYAKLSIILILGLLTAASDKLIMLQWIYPIALVSILFLLWGKASYKKVLPLLGVIVAIMLGVKPLHDFLLPNPIINHAAANPTLSLDMLSRNIPTIKSIIGEGIEFGGYNFIIVSFTLIAALMLVLVSLIYGKRKEQSTIHFIESNFIALVLIVSILANFIAFLLTDREVNARHFAPFFISPILFFPIILNFFRSINTTSKLRLGMITLLLILVLWQVNQKFKYKKFYSIYSTPLSECVDLFIAQTGAKHGIAQYWQSKNLYMLSRYPITLAQYDGSGNKYKWITTKRWYRDRYDFALIDHRASKPYYKINGAKIINKNGEPDKIFECGSTEIFYYKDGLLME